MAKGKDEKRKVRQLRKWALADLYRTVKKDRRNGRNLLYRVKADDVHTMR